MSVKRTVARTRSGSVALRCRFTGMNSIIVDALALY